MEKFCSITEEASLPHRRNPPFLISIRTTLKRSGEKKDGRTSMSNSDNITFVEDSTVDFVLTDPPFNISKNKLSYFTGKTVSILTSLTKNSEETGTPTSTKIFLLNLTSIRLVGMGASPGGNFVIFLADAYISHLIEALKANSLHPRRVVTWRKIMPFPSTEHMPMSATEYVIVGVKKGKTQF